MKQKDILFTHYFDTYITEATILHQYFSIYISFVKGNKVAHPKLVSEGRKQMKIYKISPEKNINTKELIAICKLLKKVYDLRCRE